MDQCSPFSIARLPRIAFGSGVRHKVGACAARYGRRALLVTGGSSLRSGPFWADLEHAFVDAGVTLERVAIADEPSPEQIDAAVRAYHQAEIDVVVAIGGGSALDAGKAIAGLLRPGNSVLDHLEGVGPEHPYRGPAVPFIALPTTAGTGSEATKNAVLSQRGDGGYKKSFRDESLVARDALVDPDFLQSCPPPVLAANGMDALTQLLESLVSTRANPLCAALAMDGLHRVRDALLPLYEDPGDPAARAGSHRLDINTASAAELEAIPHIGPERAAAIIALRPITRIWLSCGQWMGLGRSVWLRSSGTRRCGEGIEAGLVGAAA
ncbi:hypothetical protein CKO15_09805 [Halorhodospira abdelmalekii]|uniref:iron-containing alcohol dehydrogenase n=1 Tax=Halorhodospira abdelmalekii TaxID=421629 RepID=UPI0019088086|nr:iron-containing alcohol dehydrogenase [Halorhodospira abdelmalekii]MBK1735572.1 hypothetical protein [Halorhodospira abdelmalekii]